MKELTWLNICECGCISEKVLKCVVIYVSIDSVHWSGGHLQVNRGHCYIIHA
jgi:hypothetical protein